MMATPAETAAKLDDAFRAFAHANGDGFSAPDWIGAYDFREEGYDLGVEAFAQPDANRADWIESAVEEYPESARYLIACAADYRLAELTANAPAQREAA